MSTLKKLVLTFVHIPYTQTHKYIYFRVKWRIWLNYFPQVLKPINSFILFSWLPKGLVRVILTVQKVACNCCKSLCLYWTNQLTTKYINSLTFCENESVRKKKFVSIFFIKMILSFILVWFAKWSMVFFFFFFLMRSMVFFCLIFHALFDCHIYIFMLLYCCLKFFCLYQYWVFFIFFFPTQNDKNYLSLTKVGVWRHTLPILLFNNTILYFMVHPWHFIFRESACNYYIRL